MSISTYVMRFNGGPLDGQDIQRQVQTPWGHPANVDFIYGHREPGEDVTSVYHLVRIEHHDDAHDVAVYRHYE